MYGKNSKKNLQTILGMSEPTTMWYPVATKPLHYYDPQKNWRKLRPHIEGPRVQAQLVKDFHKFTFGRWEKPFVSGDLPAQFESYDFLRARIGRRPAYLYYVKRWACHWLVNFNLMTIARAEPDRPWRIVTSNYHSTVWDGDATIYDLNFYAFGVTAEEAFQLAGYPGRQLKPGNKIKVPFAEHYRDEQRRRSVVAAGAAGLQ